MLRKLFFYLFAVLFSVGAGFGAVAATDFYEDEFDGFEEMPPQTPEDLTAEALDNYDLEGSLFEKITNLEQDKVLMKLEAERARMGLELDELDARKIKMQRELDELAGSAQQKQQELDLVRAQLEVQTNELKQKLEELEKRDSVVKPASTSRQDYVQEVEFQESKPVSSSISKKYELVNIVGLGNQLQATVKDVATGQNKRISVGKKLDGFTVRSISLDDGIVFEKGGLSENLNTGK